MVFFASLSWNRTSKSENGCRHNTRHFHHTNLRSICDLNNWSKSRSQGLKCQHNQASTLASCYHHNHLPNKKLWYGEILSSLKYYGKCSISLVTTSNFSCSVFWAQLIFKASCIPYQTITRRHPGIQPSSCSNLELRESVAHSRYQPWL